MFVNHGRDILPFPRRNSSHIILLDYTGHWMGFLEYEKFEYHAIADSIRFSNGKTVHAAS